MTTTIHFRRRMKERTNINLTLNILAHIANQLEQMELQKRYERVTLNVEGINVKVIIDTQRQTLVTCHT